MARAKLVIVFRFLGSQMLSSLRESARAEARGSEHRSGKRSSGSAGRGGSTGYGSRRVVMVLLIALGTLAGCAARMSFVEVVDHREASPPQHYSERFAEAYYSIDAVGNVDLVLRSSEPSEVDPADDITQVVHIRSVWRAIPGKTVAERTQINATVSYGIISGPMGVMFEGAGSVFYTENRRRDTLDGSLELALLRPTRRIGQAADVFQQAEMSGKFRATHDPRRVVQIVNEMKQRFSRE
ncbi:MAG: hypothetical protein KJ749_06520 [Planctomycetes bacterium]|nr:hypothetical protein [Planctomycetota bacterium]